VGSRGDRSAEPAKARQSADHERRRHDNIGADVLLVRQRLLNIGERLLVGEEVVLVVNFDASFLELLDETVGYVERPVRNPW